MRALVKLVRNGNSTQLTVPARILNWLDWLPGQQCVITVNEDKTLHVRLFNLDEVAPAHSKPVILEEPSGARR